MDFPKSKHHDIIPPMTENLRPDFNNDNVRPEHPEKISVPDEFIQEESEYLRFVEEYLKDLQKEINEATEELEKLREDMNDSDSENPDYRQKIHEYMEKLLGILSSLSKAESDFMIQREKSRNLIAEEKKAKESFLQRGSERNN